MNPVFALTLRQLSGRWRITVLAVLAAMPPLLALLMLRSDSAPSVGDFDLVILGGMLAGSIAPLVVLAIAGAAFANEVEDRTLANLTLAPVSRSRIVVPKLLGALAIAGPFIAASAYLTSWMGFLGDPRAALAVTAAALAGVAVYTALFVWLGLRTTQAIGVGLLYIVLWEGFFAGFVAGARLFSIRYYAIALMHGLDQRRFAGMSHVSLGVAVAVMTSAFAALLYLSIRRLSRMDVP